MKRNFGLRPKIGQSVPYRLRDEFSDARAAGAVNGTYATDGHSLRTIVDSNSKLSLHDAAAYFANGGAGIGDPILWYPGETRKAGQAIIGHWAGTNSNYALGFTNNKVGGVITSGINPSAAGVLRVFINGTALVVGNTPTSGVDTYVMIVQRAAGTFFFIKTATAYPQWTLLYPDNSDTTATLYPGLGVRAATTVFNSNFIRGPQNIILVVPLASDAFTRADGALGLTGGGGSEESGGSGRAWVQGAGTWGVATGKAAASALAGGIANAVVDCETPNVMVEAVITRTSGNAGLLLRYTDENNYIKAYLDGTNLVIVEVVNGTPNTLGTTAVTYGATKRTVLSANGTKVRVYYGDALVGNELTTAVTTGNGCGFHTTHTGATFDNFVVWAKGNGNEYAVFDRYIAPT